MYKIMRLAWTNIKKHKKESISLFLLITVCMMLFASALSTRVNVSRMAEHMGEITHSKENYVFFSNDSFDEHYGTLLAEDENVSGIADVNGLYSLGSTYIDRNNEEQSMYMLFITLETEKKFADAEIETTLSDEEIAALEHPVFMPWAGHDSMGYEVGDTFTMIYGGKEYPFTVAGFFPTVLFPTPAGGMKFIISDEDYRSLERLLGEYRGFAYETAPGTGYDVKKEFIDKCRDYSGKSLYDTFTVYKEELQEQATSYTDIIELVMIVMSLIIIISVALVIHMHITGDIKDQMVNIGVLEAIGYTSKDIALSYGAEYLMIAAAGSILGGICSLFLSRVLFGICELVCGTRGEYSPDPIFGIVTGIGICLIITAVALVRAGMVRRYPAVRALRKGTADHHFAADILPLRNTKSNVHLRLAMKGIFGQLRQSVTIMVSVAISVAAVLTILVFRRYLSSDMGLLKGVMGMEMSELNVTLQVSADPDEAAEQIRGMEGVRKVLATTNLTKDYLSAPELNDYQFFVVSYEDFEETENIFLCEGRFPVHDNEIMLARMNGTKYNIHTGDTVTLEKNKARRDYIVTGFVTSITNNGANLYMTHEGYRAIDPLWQPADIGIYLEEGVDKEAFKSELTRRYGKTVADAHKESGEGEGSLEEKLRRKADKYIAHMLSVYGAVNVEYTVQSGDTVVTGGSDSFMIASTLDYAEVARTQLGGFISAVGGMTALFMVLTALVIMGIIFIIMEQEVRREYRELGVMLSMGYTTRELMIQLALRLMPAVIVAVILGIAGSRVILNGMSGYLGQIIASPLVTAAASAAVVVFCFACAYLGARKIKDISVYELITE
ncbi:MAG: FtsX-like permease family protein [Oscillospiraceae bacterium]|nr:FtsX-like permease family protein [Oscillospiraceae bacterium]